MLFKISFKRTLSLAILLLLQKMAANKTNFNICQSQIEIYFDWKWLTNDFINILKHILAVIEDLFQSNLQMLDCNFFTGTASKKSDLCSTCIVCIPMQVSPSCVVLLGQWCYAQFWLADRQFELWIDNLVLGVEWRWEAINKTPYLPLPITDLDLIADLDHLHAKFFLSFHYSVQVEKFMNWSYWTVLNSTVET